MRAVAYRRAAGPAAGVSVRGRLRAAVTTHWYAWAMVTPVVLVTAVIVGYPLVRGVYLSMTDATELTVGRRIGAVEIPPSYEFVGLDNYLAILTGRAGPFASRLGWTVVWTLACVSLHFTLGLVLAVMLNRRLRGRGVYRVLLVLPWAVPPFVSVFIWRYLFNAEYGAINAGLAGLGLPTVDWLNDPLTAKIAVIAVNVWAGVPFMMLALLGGLQAIPGELYEAAEVDGASAWQRFRHVTLPGLRGVSATVLLLGTIWTFNMFPIIYLLTRGGPADATEILVTYAYRKAFEGIRDYSGAAAYGVLILVMLVVLAVGYQRALRRQGALW